MFGSSQGQLQSRPSSRIPAPNFQSSSHGNTYSPRTATHTHAFLQAQKQNAARGPTSHTIRAPSDSPQFADEDYDEEADADADAMDEDEDIMSRSRAPGVTYKRSLRSSMASDPLYSPKRSRFGASILQSTVLGRAEPTPDTNSIAKGLAAAMPEPSLHEQNSLILETEAILDRLQDSQKVDPASESVLAGVAADLCALWDGYANELQRQGRSDSTIGPSDKEHPIVKATFVAELLLQLHHPPRNERHPNFSQSRFGRSSLASSISAATSQGTTIPKVLWNWLNKYHDPQAGDLKEVLAETNGYSASEVFWDVVFGALFRGRFSHVIKLLKGANWRVAACAIDDGYEEPGYTGRQLQQVEIAINRLITLLESCPAVRNDDWDVKGNDWTLFRHRTRQAQKDLQMHASESNSAHGDLFNPNDSLASARSSVFGASSSSRSADNKLPSYIVDSLDDMFTTILGSHEEVLKNACDWVEGVVGPTAWWDGESVDNGKSGLAGGRKSFQRIQQTRSADITPLLAYRDRLGRSLTHIWNSGEEQLQINTSNPVEVAVACVFAEDVEGALAILESWSVPIASAVAEVASSGGWLDVSKRVHKHITRTLDQSDLMVLDYGSEPKQEESTKKDTILSGYASLLQDKGTLTPPEAPRQIQGWEVAAQVLSRLDSDTLRKIKMSELLGQLPLDSEEHANKLLSLCHALEMESLAQSVAQVCDDFLQ